MMNFVHFAFPLFLPYSVSRLLFHPLPFLSVNFSTLRPGNENIYMAAREWALGRNKNGGGDGRSSLKMDKCRERMAVPVVCFRRQYGAFVLLHG